MARAATWLGAFWYVMALGVFVAAGAFATPAAAGNSKVVICHIPPGDPDNAHTITVSEKAVQAHLKHGDWLGECASGCLNSADCDDENLCTDDECLSNGECSHVAVDCDDSNVCTDDLCNPLEGCFYPPVSVTTGCNDGNVCTGGDACEAGICTGTDIPDCCRDESDCDDAEWCTDDSCDENNVCAYSPVDCSIQNDACWVGSCDSLASMCVAALVSCDDLNVCTEDLCDSVTGCYNPPTTNPPEPGIELTCGDGVDNDCDGFVDGADPDCAGLPCSGGYPGLVYGGYDYAGRPPDDLNQLIWACRQEAYDTCPDVGVQILEEACLVPFISGDSCVSCLTDGLACSACAEERWYQLNMVCANITLDACDCTATETPEISCDDGVDNDCDGLTDGDDGDCGECSSLPQGTVCRPPAGPCDIAEVCDGLHPTCPLDEFVESDIACRLAVDACDVAEFCDGNSAICPADSFAPAGTPCRDEDSCDGAGGCFSLCSGGALYPGLVYGGYDYAGRPPDDLNQLIWACRQEAYDTCPDVGVQILEEACLVPFISGDSCVSCLTDGLACSACAEERWYQLNMVCANITLDACDCTATETPEISCDDGVDNDCDRLVDGDDSDCAPACVPSDEVCDDGVDNDCDGLVDSEDGDCGIDALWTGTVTQVGGSSYPAQIAANGLDFDIAYPTLGCTGNLTLGEVSGNTYEFIETIGSGSCLSGGAVVLTVDGVTMQYAYFLPGTNELGAEGTLNRSVPLDGLWTGTVTQVGGSSYPAQIAANGLDFDIAYPTLGCTGNLTLGEVSGNTYEFIETIGSGSCLSGGAVVLTVDGVTMQYAYFLPGTNELGAEGTLNRSVPLDGLWTGTVTQVGGSSYPAQIAANGLDFDIAYPTLGCTGNLTLGEVSGNTYEFIETIGSGSCLSGGAVVLTVDGVTMQYAYFLPGTNELGAEGTLNRSVPLDGLWTGTVTQVGGSSYPAQIAANGLDFDIAYPTLGCTGNLTLGEVSGNTYEFIETIGSGSCLSGGAVVLTVDGVTMQYAYFLPGTNELGAEGTLNRSD